MIDGLLPGLAYDQSPWSLSHGQQIIHALADLPRAPGHVARIAGAHSQAAPTLGPLPGVLVDECECPLVGRSSLLAAAAGGVGCGGEKVTGGLALPLLMLQDRAAVHHYWSAMHVLVLPDDPAALGSNLLHPTGLQLHHG